VAEEWGTVIIKASAEIVSLLQEVDKSCEAAVRLGQVGQIAEDKIMGLNCGIDDLVVKGDYAQLSFNCSDWKPLTEMFVRDAVNIEWYATIYDEYGTADFYLLNSDGERFHLNFDQGGDLCEIDGYEEEVREKIAKWESLMPDALKSHFPEFIDMDHLEFDGP